MFGIRPWYMDSMDVKVLDLLRATQIMRPAAPREHLAAPAAQLYDLNLVEEIRYKEYLWMMRRSIDRPRAGTIC